MVRRAVKADDIKWRGSITDLATDVAYLLNEEEGARLIAELQRFQALPHLKEKWAGTGYESESEASPDDPCRT